MSDHISFNLSKVGYNVAKYVPYGPVNEVMPYVQSGQMVGVLAGMPGAAEYESLIGQKGSATSGMDAQSVAHLVIVLFIVLGNISYFIDRKRSRKVAEIGSEVVKNELIAETKGNGHRYISISRRSTDFWRTAL